LAESLDYETTLARVARLAVPYLADCCIVDMLEEEGRIRRLAVAHGASGKEALARELEQHPPAPDSEQGVANVLRTGQPELRSVVEEAFIPSVARDSEHLRILRELEPKSHLIAPLIARGRTLGAISLVTTPESGRRYRHADIASALELAHRASLAVDNARLYREAQEAIRLRNEFISVAAHELKTPVTSLLLSAQLAVARLEKSGTLEPERLRAYMQTIGGQASKLSRLISQLLDVSRIESGRLALEKEDVDIRELAEEVVRSAGGRADVRVMTSGAAQLKARVDSLRLEQVLTNLLNNALVHSESRDQIDVQLSEAPDGFLEIVVADHGRGIPEEYRAHIFERFFRVPGLASTGMGLGLYISRDIVQLHGGELRAEFPSAGGARFIVRLPINASTASP